ncbi:MAG: single-stranded DNA-binding protein [bacterium]|nr:single-stranded DNA-binding protein [bacterium]
MLNLNRAQVLGNLTKDPDMRFTPNGQAVANFTVATNRKWKGRDGAPDGEATEYHDIVVWGKQAEAVVPMLKKGGPAFVEGRLQTRNWEGQDGIKRYKTEIIADNIIVLNSRSGGGSYTPKSNDSSAPAPESATDAPSKNSDEEIDIEEIPF